MCEGVLQWGLASVLARLRIGNIRALRNWAPLFPFVPGHAMQTLASLPVTVIAHITQFLTADSLLPLVFSGDRLLYSKCTAHGGVTKLGCCADAAILSLAFCSLPPSVFGGLTSVIIEFGHDTNLLDAWIRQLPSTLLELRLNFPRAISCWLRPVDETNDPDYVKFVCSYRGLTVELLDERFPKLRVLHLQGNLEKTFSYAMRRRFVEHLPTFIASLCLPIWIDKDFGDPLDAQPILPPRKLLEGLEELVWPRSTVETPTIWTFPAQSDCNLPLSTLLFIPPYSDPLMPSSLTNLSIHTRIHFDDSFVLLGCLPFLRTLRLPELHYTGTPTEGISPFSKLPGTLQTLELRLHPGRIPLVPLLFQTPLLTSLILDFISPLNARDLFQLTNLPPGLTELSIRADCTISLPTLPETMKHLTLRCLVDFENDNSFLSSMPSLTIVVTDRLSWWTPNRIGRTFIGTRLSFPASLTSLDAGTTVVSTSQLSEFSKSILHLTCDIQLTEEELPLLRKLRDWTAFSVAECILQQYLPHLDPSCFYGRCLLNDPLCRELRSALDLEKYDPSPELDLQKHLPDDADRGSFLLNIKYRGYSERTSITTLALKDLPRQLEILDCGDQDMLVRPTGYPTTGVIGHPDWCLPPNLESLRIAPRHCVVPPTEGASTAPVVIFPILETAPRLVTLWMHFTMAPPDSVLQHLPPTITNLSINVNSVTSLQLPAFPLDNKDFLPNLRHFTSEQFVISLSNVSHRFKDLVTFRATNILVSGAKLVHFDDSALDFNDKSVMNAGMRLIPPHLRTLYSAGIQWAISWNAETLAKLPRNLTAATLRQDMQDDAPAPPRSFALGRYLPSSLTSLNLLKYHVSRMSELRYLPNTLRSLAVNVYSNLEYRLLVPPLPPSLARLHLNYDGCLNSLIDPDEQGRMMHELVFHTAMMAALPRSLLDLALSGSITLEEDLLASAPPALRCISLACRSFSNDDALFLLPKTIMRIAFVPSFQSNLPNLLRRLQLSLPCLLDMFAISTGDIAI